MNKPKVALVTPGSFIIPSDKSSSVEHVMVELANQLSRFTDCTVYGIREGGLKPAEYRQQVRYLRPAGRKGYRQGVIRSLRREGYDLVQVDNRPRLARAVKKAVPAVRVWLTLHSLTFVSPKQISQRELADCFRHMERIIVNSHYLREEIARLVPGAADKIQVIYPGVDTALFKSRWSPEGHWERTELLNRLGYQNKKMIVYVGRLVDIKGVHHLLQAMQKVAAAVPEAVLMVVGGAFYGSKRITPYVRRLHRMGRQLPRHIRFIPYIPHNEIPKWFLMADVAVVPSPRREAFGLVNVEAMAAGVPVLAAEAGGMKEIVVHGVTGLLVPVAELENGIAEGLIALLSNPGQVHAMGQAAAVRVKEVFVWETAALQWLSLAGFETFYG
jgi:spore coat protein SA